MRDVGDEAERATRETENSLELRTRDRYRKLINKIDSTLKRIDDGSYGYCVDTGDEIGLERLEARLTAERTHRCAGALGAPAEADGRLIPSCIAVHGKAPHRGAFS